LPPDSRCYSNTSRDQLTLAVYGLWRVVHTGKDISPELRKEASRLIELIACDCRKHIVPETRYNLLRLDGKPALASEMWDCYDHEALRLPMVYIAAFEATGKGCYLDWAHEYLPVALEKTLSSKEQHFWWHLPITQMQLSILLIAESKCVPEYTSRLSLAMEKLASFAEMKVREAIEKTEAFHGNWEIPNENFRFCPMKIQYATISADRRNALFAGKPYSVPIWPEEFRKSRELLHELGSYLTIYLAPGTRTFPDEWMKRIDRIVSSIDFSRHCSDGGVKLLHALSFLALKPQPEQIRRIPACVVNS